MAETPNVDQIRHAIDSGKTGEKVGYPDPAAAPLGTDAEAGGHPPSADELRMEAASAPIASGPQRDLGLPVYLLLVSSVSVLILSAVFIGHS